MPPAIRVVVGDECLHPVPFPPLDGAEKVRGVQPHLPRGLPEPRGIKGGGREEGAFFQIHERD